MPTTPADEPRWRCTNCGETYWSKNIARWSENAGRPYHLCPTPLENPPDAWNPANWHDPLMSPQRLGLPPFTVGPVAPKVYAVLDIDPKRLKGLVDLREHLEMQVPSVDAAVAHIATLTRPGDHYICSIDIQVEVVVRGKLAVELTYEYPAVSPGVTLVAPLVPK